MKTRTILAAVTALTIVIGSSSAALAWSGNCWNQNTQQVQNVTPEQQAAIQKIMNDSDKRLDPLMEQMQAKRMELNALSGNTNAKPEIITKLSAEIASLQTQIRNEMNTRNDSIVAQGGMNGNMGGYHNGMGRHGGRGGHNGMGRGNHNGHAANDCPYMN